jgi:hypothetical protein
VTAITLSAPNRPDLSLERLEPVAQDQRVGPAGWQIVLRGGAGQGPQTRPADSEAVRRLLTELAQLTAERFLSDAPQAADLENWGFNRPERQVSLTLQSQPPGSRLAAPVSPVVLQLGVANRRDNHAYARLTSESSVYIVDPDILRETAVAPRAWRDRLLRDLPAGASITSLAITDLPTGASVFTWASAAGAPAPSEAVQTVLAQLRTLRAKGFEADAFTEKVEADGDERPWKYRLDAVVSLPGGEGRVQTSVSTLFLSNRLGASRQIAGSREFDAVFDIEQPFLDALWTLTYGARDLGPAPAGK